MKVKIHPVKYTHYILPQIQPLYSPLCWENSYLAFVKIWFPMLHNKQPAYSFFLPSSIICHSNYFFGRVFTVWGDKKEETMSGTVQKIIHISLSSACTYFWKTTAALKTSFWELCLSQNTRSQANMPSYLTWACKYSLVKDHLHTHFFCPCKNPQMPEILPEAPKVIFISLHSLLYHPKTMH